MGWIKLDDGFLDHPKFIEAGPLAAYLNICAIAWCNRNRTDGEIPRGQVPRLVNFEGFAHHMWQGELVGGGEDAEPYEIAAELVSVGLWEPTDKGWRIHDYLDWQASREEIEAARQQRVEAGRRGGRARAGKPMPSVPLNGSSSTPPSEPPSGSSSETASKSQANAKRDSSKKEEVRSKNPPNPPRGNRARLVEEQAGELGFEEWLLDHHAVTGKTVPAVGTKTRATLAAQFVACCKEVPPDAPPLPALKLATRAAHANEHRRDNGYDGAENVLRPTKILNLIDNGRRMANGNHGSKPPTLAEIHAAERAHRERKDGAA